MKKPAEGLQAHLSVTMPTAQVDVLAHRIALAVAPVIDTVVKQAIADFLARVGKAPVEHANGGNGRSLAELMSLPAGALVTPAEASLLTGLPIERMKSKRRFESFPEAVRVGHRTIKWRMGDLRKYLKEAT